MTEREAVIAFLREEQAKFDRAANSERWDEGDHTTIERLDAKASVLRTMSAYIERGDHIIGRGPIEVECSMCGHKQRVER